ncbi:MAG: fimbrillin family protein [Rikenellaceae bacterium]
MKLTTILSIVVVVLYSCVTTTLDELQDAETITFTTEILTRGALTQNRDELSEFGVYAYNDAEFVMDNIEVVRSDNEWVYSPEQSWGTDGFTTLKFAAYAPFATLKNGISVTSESLIIRYDMPTQTAIQPDLMVANYTINSATGYVNLHFSHALAAVNFKTIDRADSLMLSGIATSGELDMEVATWSNIENPTTDEFTIKITDYQSADGYLIMAVPQSLSSSATVTLYYNGEATSYSMPMDSWVAGKIYNYEIAEDDGFMKLSSVENCYIINPYESLSYKFDAVCRVNQYWGDSSSGGVDGEHPSVVADGAGYIALGCNDNAIGDNCEWYLELIWSEFNVKNLIEFEQSEGCYGVGKELAKFTLTTQAMGNILIGLKKRGGDNYLWSWHIWITDYDPDNPDERVYLPDYEVNGFYNYGREIMDRNLGAMSCEGSSSSSYGLYYQWGRKDPFYSYGYYYNGDCSASPEVSTTVEIAKDGSVLNCFYNPTIFYYTLVYPNDPYYSSGDDIGNNYDYNRWGGCENSISSTPFENDKTIYDPCPEGWRVPSGSSWSGFDSGNFSAGNSCGVYNGNSFPYCGTRHYLNDGDIYQSGSNGYYWSATPDDVTEIDLWLTSYTYVPSHLLSIEEGDVDGDWLYFKTSGFSVRPMRIATSLCENQ